jgi:quinol monooxygenase YgiN
VFARSTTIQANPSSVDAGLVHVRDEVLPALQQLDGFIGLSMLVDRQAGRCILTSAWRDRDALHASAATVAPLRARVADMLGGRPEVEQWEIAVMHRHRSTPAGAWVRSSWLQSAPDRLEEALTIYTTGALPQIERLDGFCSASFLINHASGRSVSSLCFDSRAAMAATRGQANQIRAAATQKTNTAVLDVHEFQLALAHLRVPEMA